MKFVKILLGLIALLVLIVVGVAAYLSTMDFNQFKPMIQAEAKKATGRDLVIDGDLNLKIFTLSPALVVEGVKFQNAEWGSAPNMATVERVEAEVSVMPLLSGQVAVNRIVVVKPDILLETDKSGKGNWEMTPAQAAADTAKETAEESGDSGALPEIAISEIKIEGAKLTYKDGVTGKTETVTVESLIASGDDLDSPIDLDLVMAYNDNPITLKGTIGAISKVTANDTFTVQLAIEAGGLDVGLNGHVAKPMDAKGIAMKFDVKGDSLAGLSGLAGTDVPGLGPIAVSGTASDVDGGYMVKDLQAKIGDSDVSGNVTALIGGAKPKIVARLTSTLFDVKDVTGEQTASESGDAVSSGGGSAASGSATSDKVFPSDPLPLDGLKSVDADVTFKGEKIIAPPIVAEIVDVGIVLENGKLTVKPLNAAVFGGTIVGDLVLDGRSGTTAALKANIKGSKIALGQMVNELTGNPVLEGAPTDFTVDVTGSGGSVAALMASLNGKAFVESGKGQINNKYIDLAGGDLVGQVGGMLNPFGEKKSHTEMYCMVVNFPITNGMVENETGIGFETSEMFVLGGGQINLKTEDLDMAINPTMRQDIGLSAGGVVSLMRIGGTLANPKPQLDPKGALKTVGKVGAAVATGGLSLLAESVLDSATEDEDSCAIAAGRKTPEKKSSSSSSDSGSSTLESVGDKLKGALGGGDSSSSSTDSGDGKSGLGGAIKGLFGN